MFDDETSVLLDFLQKTFSKLFNENAILLKVIVNSNPRIASKAKLTEEIHKDVFQLIISTPKGFATFYLPIEKYWDWFDCEEIEKPIMMEKDCVNEIAFERIVSLIPEKKEKRWPICPYCGGDFYRYDYSESTMVYYPPIYKNGINVNPDQNKKTSYYTCLNCGKQFTTEA